MKELAIARMNYINFLLELERQRMEDVGNKVVCQYSNDCATCPRLQCIEDN